MSYEQIIKRFSMSIYLKDSQDRKGIALVQQSNQSLTKIIIYLVETKPSATEEDWARYFLKN